ncbi:MAG: hypothetical protein ACPG4X_14655 [Pikeienuella sp.]
MTAKNESGIRPLEYKVLVQPDPIQQKTQGGILLPDDTHEREEWAQVKATIVAIGDSAFSDWTVRERGLLKPGVRVYCAKYQGIVVTGDDGEEYRLLSDKDIGAIITREGAMQSTTMGGRSKGGLAAA